MKVVQASLLYLLGVLAGAATLSPWIYWSVQWLNAHGIPLDSLTNQPFHRYVNRTLLLLALAGILPFWRVCAVRGLSGAGLTAPSKTPSLLKKILFGALVTLLQLALVVVSAILLKSRHVGANLDPIQWGRLVATALSSACLVAVVEEVFFRGTLYQGMSRSLGHTKAMIASSLIYSLVHFFEKAPAPASITASSGWQVLWAMLGGFTKVDSLIPGFLSLFIVGCTLCVAAYRTRDLYLSIGLHSGWIFWLKIYGRITDPVGDTPSRWWGSDRLLDGWFAFALLIPTFFIINLYLSRTCNLSNQPKDSNH